MKNRKYKGMTLIELLVFMLFIAAGIAVAGYLGNKFGCVGKIIGFPLGIGSIIGVFYIIFLISDTSGTLKYNRKNRLDKFAKTLHHPDLNLRNKPFTDNSLNYLLSHANLKPDNIKSFDLSYTKITDRSLQYLSAFNNLETLDLAGTKIKGDGLCNLGNHSKLIRLRLWDCRKLTDESIRHINYHANLQVLVLAFSSLRDQGLLSLDNLPALKEVDIRNCKISDAGLSHITLFSTLQKLDVCRNKITDRSMEVIGQLSELETLSINGTQISPDSIPYLKQLLKLKTLTLPRKFSKKHQQELKAHLPDCNIYIEPF